MNNLSRVRAQMAERGIPALFVSDILNIRWLCGFTGSTAFCVVTPDRALFLTDGRYTIQAEQEVHDFEVMTFSPPKTWGAHFAEAFAAARVDRICFETSARYAQVDEWRRDFPNMDWLPMDSILSDLRMIKTADELEKIKIACRLADAVMEHAVRLLQPGVTEMDILLDLEFFIKRQGATPAFDTIVVSGPNSARPHGKPGERRLQSGDFVTLDLGAKLNGYNSDITRTFVIGEASDRHRQVYEAVLRAEEEAIAFMKPGVSGKDVDARSREVLGDLAQYFVHGLGHGLGLNVHDYGSLSTRSTDILAPGMVFTVEPGVYIEGFGGVRIEDDVVVTETGVEVLTHFPKELMVLP
jgi:Xaa-Pro aminopeptidase